MKHAQQKPQFASRQFTTRGLRATILLAACVVGSSTAVARDQHYLDILNEEADQTGVVANTGKSLTPSKPTKQSLPQPRPTNKPAAKKNQDDQPSFIMQVNAKLNPGAKPDEPDDESKYLEQLENEVQKLTVPTSGNPQQKAGAAKQINDAKPPTITASQRTNAQPNAQAQTKQPSITAKQQELVKFTEAQRKELEMALEIRIPGIYHLYKQLGLSEKRVVLRDFMKTKKLSTASKSILKLYSGD